MTTTETAAVAYEIGGDLLQIVLQRPKANALGLPIIEGIEAALDAADAEGGVKYVVVSSAIPGFFAAGADIKLMATIDGAGFADYGNRLRGVLDRLAAPDRISVAAVDGLALGGGLELAIACTLRVAGEQASFGLPEVKLGLIPGAGGTQRLPRLVGRGHALDIMLTARQVPAAEALSMGLVNRLVPAGEAHGEAIALVDQLRATSFPALQAIVRTVDASFDRPLDAGILFEAEQEQVLFDSGEATEGIAAFVGKRPPHFA
jgi:enoyl-CoA hydratase/carnithine racemase